jgi:hypothetical protein
VLTTKPASGEELEGERLKAKFGVTLIERDLLHRKIACWRPTSLWPSRDAYHQRSSFTGEWPPLRVGYSVPGLARCPIGHLSPSEAVRGTAPAPRTGSGVEVLSLIETSNCLLFQICFPDKRSELPSSLD